MLRGKEILVRCVRTSPTFAFLEDNPDFKGLEWFLHELKQNLTTEGGRQRKTKEKQSEDEEEEMIIEEIMENIRGHGNCSKAWFLDSRSSIRVVARDERHKEFFLKDTKKKRRQALIQQDREGWDQLRSAFLEANDAVILFLDEKAPGASSSAGPQAETRGPPVQPKTEADEEPRAD